jgi:hypothetical protein
VVAQFDAQSQQDRLDDYRDTVVQLETSIQSMRSNLVAIKEAQEQSVRQAKADWDKALWDLKTAPVLSDIDVEKGKLAAEEAEARTGKWWRNPRCSRRPRNLRSAFPS